MGNLAELLAEKGEHREAELLFREILQVERERLGPRHPDTLGSMQRLAGYCRTRAELTKQSGWLGKRFGSSARSSARGTPTR